MDLLEKEFETWRWTDPQASDCTRELKQMIDTAKKLFKRKPGGCIVEGRNRGQKNLYREVLSRNMVGE